MKFKDALYEYETWTDDDGYTIDDEGNREFTGMSGGHRGLHDDPWGRGNYRRGNLKSKKPLSDLEKAYRFANSLGVDKKDVDRYVKSGRGKWPAVYSMIKNKAKKMGKIR